jgi:hypothetical protein
MKKLLIIVALMATINLNAAEYILQWSVSNSNNIAGYIVRYHSSTGMSAFVDVGSTTKWKLQLVDGRSYQVTVHSYDANKNESKASNVVTINVPAPLQPPTLAVPSLQINK